MASAPGPRAYQRRQLLVNPPLQYQFIGIMLSVLLLLTIGALASVYFALWFTLRTYSLTEDPVAVAQLTTVGLVVTFELLVIAPVVVWIGLRMTHKVAGPLVRIMAVLREMTTGNFRQRITLRKGDSLRELADAVNTLAEFLRTRVG
ncbi:MAG: HAMP domain-containing protein [Candidatus Omnitrophica bacterium]|nr:HAMP domain-containing protein [Candidatus Omnitrophota bacterium]